MPINDPEKSENMRKSIRVYSGSSNRPLAQKIAEYLGVELSGLTLKQFANGEIYARYDETVRGADVFLIQSVAGGNVNDMLMELLIATDAAKRASARSITAVITHYGYARQDRKAGPREPITARLVANLLERAGVEVVQPQGEAEEAIHGMIYDGVKAGNMGYDTTAVREALAQMAAEGCEAFVLGCTEVPVAVEMYHLEGNFIDATEVLAEEAVRQASAKVISHLPHKTACR